MQRKNKTSCITLNCINVIYIVTTYTYNISIVRIKDARLTIGSSEESQPSPPTHLLLLMLLMLLLLLPPILAGILPPPLPQQWM